MGMPRYRQTGSFEDVAAPKQFDGVCDDETSALHDGCNMSTADIVEWVRTLPESRVPETSQENIVSNLQNNDMCGAKFTQFAARATRGMSTEARNDIEVCMEQRVGRRYIERVGKSELGKSTKTKVRSDDCLSI